MKKRAALAAAILTSGYFAPDAAWVYQKHGMEQHCEQAGLDCEAVYEFFHDCHVLPNGNVCRFGREYGKGKGGDTECKPGYGSIPIPCNSDQGAGLADRFKGAVKE